MHLPDQYRHSCYVVLGVRVVVDGESNYLMTDDLVRLGKVVRQTRQAAAMTVRELASLIRVSYAYISITELGENPATNKPSKPSRRACPKSDIEGSR